MTLEEHLIIHLKATVPVFVDRVYRAGTLYTNMMPAMTIQRITGAPFYVHQGRCDKRTSELQLSIYSNLLASLDTLVAQVESAMDNFSVSGDGGRPRQTNYADRGYDADSKLFSVSLDYEVIH